MPSTITSFVRTVSRTLLVAALFTTLSAFAGSPLICHPYAIGKAKSLPSGNDWHGVSRNYDRANLVADTLSLLTPETPVIVRMETLRRAAIYATSGMRAWDKGTYTAEDRALAFALLEKLREIATKATGSSHALALFDVGFFTETLRQTNIDRSLNGYAVLLAARDLRGPDADMEFALALATTLPKRQEHVAHLVRAREGARDGSLLAVNLTSHFGQ
jgi:hypothetical protein